MRSRTRILSAAICMLAALAITGHASAQSQILSVETPATSQFITTFDPPGSTNTQADSINREGGITGSYFKNMWHGFLRHANGTIVTFDPPGSTVTQAHSINEEGAVTGSYFGGNMWHGFLRESALQQRLSQ